MVCFILVFSKFLVLVVKNQKKLEKTKKKTNPSLLSPMRLFLLPEPLATWRNILFFFFVFFLLWVVVRLGVITFLVVAHMLDAP